MKKRLIGILLCLCMVLMLCPVTAFAEGETLTPVTDISFYVDAPIIGEALIDGRWCGSRPYEVMEGSITWYRILKTEYTGGEEDLWEVVLYDGTPCTEDYYYMVVGYVWLLDRYSSSHTIPENVDAAVNGKSCDVSVAEDGKSCTLTYVFEGTVPRSIEGMDVKVYEPVIGKIPDQSPVVTGAPEGSIANRYFSCWYKLPADQEPSKYNENWEAMAEGEVFTDGYYYLVGLMASAESGFFFDDNTLFTWNGKEAGNSFVGASVYGSNINVIIVFDPLEPIEPPEPQYTVTVTAEPVRENPDTGDNSIFVLGGLLLLAVGAAAVTKAVCRKRK